MILKRLSWVSAYMFQRAIYLIRTLKLYAIQYPFNHEYRGHYHNNQYREAAF